MEKCIQFLQWKSERRKRKREREERKINTSCGLCFTLCHKINISCSTLVNNRKIFLSLMNYFNPAEKRKNTYFFSSLDHDLCFDILLSSIICSIYWYELKNRIPKAGLELLQLGWQSLNAQNMTMSYRFCHQGLRLSHVDLVVWNSCTCVILSDNAFNLNFHHTKIDIHICHPQVSLLLCKFNDLEL